MTTASDFWSRRKAAVQAEAEAEQRAAARRAEEAAAAARAQRSDAEILQELDLPDPDALQPGDDIAGFMARAVPERLRRRALRRLWRLNPALANVDGLVDYGEDFTDAATVIEGLSTAYTVGKGLVGSVMADAPPGDAPGGAAAGAAAGAAPESAVSDAPETASQTARAETEIPPPPDPDAAAARADEAGAAPDEAEIANTAPAPRRMQFTFEG